MGSCPWGSSLGAVLAALAAQEGREQGPGEGGGRREEGGSTWPVSRQGKGVAGRASWHPEGMWGETSRPEFVEAGSVQAELAFTSHLLCVRGIARTYM